MPEDPQPSEPTAAPAADELVELVVELEPVEPAAARLSRAEKIAAHKEAFERQAAPVAAAIAEAGGEVVGRAWINQTLKARIPRHAVAAVARHEKVAQVDVPRPLELEDAEQPDDSR
ncbi:MAG: hypothetical protein ACE5GX_06955 [Thermoanaerobaculia bacterium]